MSTSSAEQLDAIVKLQKLLDRQHSEVRETEELLQTLKKTSIGSYGKGDKDIISSIYLGVDYGFISRSEGNEGDLIGGLPSVGEKYAQSDVFDSYGPPSNIWKLGVQAFTRNLNAIKGEYSNEENKKLTKEQRVLHEKLNELTLNSTAIWEREETNNDVDAPIILKIPYLAVCYLLDFVFEGKYVPSRFYLLETVARTPYFSYIAMLHLYETLGWWRRSSDVKRIHFAEEWNEYNHLLIMESLGGDQEWWVRFAAYHSAIIYYWTLIALWALSPTLAYKFSELLETHAVNTYSQFLDENEALLQDMPASVAAIEYYSFGASDTLFGEYQTSVKEGEEIRRPGDKMRTLHDVFSAIRDDEGDHVSTMKSCLDPNVASKTPSVERRLLVGGAMLAAFAYYMNTNEIPSLDDFEMILGDSDGGLLDPGIDGFLAGGAAAGQQFLFEDDNGVFSNVLGDDVALESILREANRLAILVMEFLSKFL